MACLSSMPSNGVSSPAALRARRLPLLMLGAVSLVAGLLTGLARLGVPVPDGAAGLALLHGPLMAGGFFGTVIGLERAAALGRAWVYGGPLATGLGGVLLVIGAPLPMGAGRMALGAASLAAASVMVWRGHRAGFTAVMAGAAACWLLGTLLWLAGVPVAGVVLWWLLFLVLTIAGERLELSRFRPPSRWAVPAFAVTIGALVLGGAARAGFGASSQACAPTHPTHAPLPPNQHQQLHPFNAPLFQATAASPTSSMTCSCCPLRQRAWRTPSRRTPAARSSTARGGWARCWA